MRIHLEKNNSENLILFFCGWGMDENPFSILNNTSDVLYVYDYTTPEFDVFDFSAYKKVDLLAFSYGVYASGITNLCNVKVNSCTAINGTLVPVDDKLGVPIRQFELTEKMDSQTVVKFRERLFGGEKAKEHFEIFENHLPKRNAQSCTQELMGMKRYVPQFPVPSSRFDKVYISKYDRCVPTSNQQNFWRNVSNVEIKELETGHFPFYNYNSLEELLSSND